MYWVPPRRDFEYFSGNTRVISPFQHHFSTMEEQDNSEKPSATIEQAVKWSDGVLSEVLNGRPVLHYICLAASEKKVYDRTKGTQKDLYQQAAVQVNSKILSRVTYLMRQGTTQERRRPALLKWEKMKEIVENEINRFIARDTDEAMKTGQGDEGLSPADMDHEKTLRDLFDLKAAHEKARSDKKSKGDQHQSRMAAYARELIQKTGQSLADNSDESEEYIDLDNDDSGSEKGKKGTLATGFKGNLSSPTPPSHPLSLSSLPP